ncbi:Flavin-binding monooxygenase-like [seawater metagenome]|uniref:Flavin-binding monooxygenase-like n=1 Tax=seawater metagenome TaxID=1561972 RepID=A0A5E8CIY0_9ZZZZ
MKKTICIIGAGASGITILEKLIKHIDKFQVICYEKQDWIGGIWHPLHLTHTYPGMILNGSKEDFDLLNPKIEDVLKQKVDNFFSKEVYYKYLITKVKTNNIDKFIKFNHRMEICKYSTEIKKFEVTVQNEHTVYNKFFDYVIVANGIYTIENKLKDELQVLISNFKGKIFHSKYLYQNNNFHNKKILIIGGGPSAEDVALHAINQKAKSITINSKNDWIVSSKWPKIINFENKIINIDQNLVIYDSNNKENIDIIILCIGYNHDLNFLNQYNNLSFDNTFYYNLYDSIFHIDNPQLMFIGYIDPFFSLVLFEHQAEYIIKYLIQEIVLPNKAEMYKSMNIWKEKSMTLKDERYDKGKLIVEYLNNINKITKRQLETKELLNQINIEFNKKEKNILNFKK